ncbi:MAG: hypothetical protein K2G25_10180 [Oscillospiraceae bacterium]|nr:hypothetical protein [Oscillospiraceae bacterium]
MPLVSLRFLLFGLPLFLIGYYCIPEKGKQIYLWVSSFLLYGWGNWSALLFLTGYLCYDYVSGILVEILIERKKQKQCRFLSGGIFYFSVGLQILLLLYLRHKADSFPIGTAVRTLQGIGYLLGIYKKHHPAERNFFRLGGYLVLFPVLMSYEEFKKQSENRRQDIIALSDGVGIFIKGLAEKVVLANTFGYVFHQLREILPQGMSMLTAWLVTMTFSMYLYFELLGYSEMARGLGRCVGYDLPENFNHPFFTSGVTTFLQNWNSTLLAWFERNFRSGFPEIVPQNFKDNFNNFQKFSGCAGFVLTGILIGVWYGAGTQFLLWGLLVGICLLLEKLFLEEHFIRKHPVCSGISSGIFLQFLWVLFFSENFSQTALYWKAMLGFGNGLTDRNGLYYFVSYLGLLLIGFYIATDLFRNIEERFSQAEIGKKMAFFKPVFFGALLIFCMAFMIYQKQGENTMLFLLI